MQQDKGSENEARRFPPFNVDPLDYIGAQLTRLADEVETLNANMDYIGSAITEKTAGE